MFRALLSQPARLTTARCLCTTHNVQQTKKLDLAGIYPPIVTPFNRDEGIDWMALKDNIEKWNQIQFRGYVVQGSNGEYIFMTEKERVDLVKRVKRMMVDGKLLIGGSGCESTRSTIEMTNKMADAGADAALVVTPCYYKSGMSEDALLAHYTKVADHSHIPIILYSVPANTGIDLSVEVIVKLSLHPNIIGLKDSGGDIAKIGSIVNRTQTNNFQVLAGSASFLYAAYHLGCVGGVVALANVLGQECIQLQDLFHSGQWKEAEELQKRLIVPNIDVTRRFGVAGLKQTMDWFGYHGGKTRMPLLALDTNSIDILRKDFKKAGFL